jgi:hypothetical protein
LLHGADQPVDMHIEVAPGLDLDGIPVGELPDAFGQVGSVRHRRAIEQHRQHGNVALERGLELDAHRIG